MVIAQKIVRADRSTNQKMADAHQKLVALMRKVRTIVHFQHRQLRIYNHLLLIYCDIEFSPVLMQKLKA